MSLLRSAQRSRTRTCSLDPYLAPRSPNSMTVSSSLVQSWLPDGYNRILRSYVFGPSGFWTMAPLRYAAKFDPFSSLDCTPHALHPGAIQGKEGIKFCHLATLRLVSFAVLFVHFPRYAFIVFIPQAICNIVIERYICGQKALANNVKGGRQMVEFIWQNKFQDKIINKI